MRSFSLSFANAIYLIYQHLWYLQITVRQMFTRYLEVSERARRTTIIRIWIETRMKIKRISTLVTAVTRGPLPPRTFTTRTSTYASYRRTARRQTARSLDPRKSPSFQHSCGSESRCYAHNRSDAIFPIIIIIDLVSFRSAREGPRLAWKTENPCPTVR